MDVSEAASKELWPGQLQAPPSFKLGHRGPTELSAPLGQGARSSALIPWCPVIHDPRPNRAPYNLLVPHTCSAFLREAQAPKQQAWPPNLLWPMECKYKEQFATSNQSFKGCHLVLLLHFPFAMIQKGAIPPF